VNLRTLSSCALILMLCGGCASTGTDSAAPKAKGPQATATPGATGFATEPAAQASTYKPLPSQPTVIRGATIMTAAGEEIPDGMISLADGKIVAVGQTVDIPRGATIIEGSGDFVTPGIIDPHSHMGDYPEPGVNAHSDGNEATDPTTPQVWAQWSVWPQDPAFTRALAHGVTTVQVLPGSANLIGGRSAVLKLVPRRTAEAMMFPEAPYGLKMACGENPKRVYEDEGPSTRMGELAADREIFQQAREYMEDWDNYRKDPENEEKPEVDQKLETLAAVLRGDIFVNIHCYQADDMKRMIDLADEFGFKIRTFHHSLEAYKVRDLLREKNIGIITWADWWGFKMEAYDGIVENLALVTRDGGRAILHSDDPLGVQFLNQAAAKAMYEARRHGIDISRDQALRWITANVAWALELDDRVGTLEPGKMADVVIWDGDPFSVYTHAKEVFIDGARVYNRDDPSLQPESDFMLGQLPPEVRQ
jgi:imidazolonepropionase-like amidohydrolase